MGTRHGGGRMARWARGPVVPTMRPLAAAPGCWWLSLDGPRGAFGGGVLWMESLCPSPAHVWTL